MTRTAAGTGNVLDLRVSQSSAGAGDAFLVDAARLTALGPGTRADPDPHAHPDAHPDPTPTPTPAPPPAADTTGPTLGITGPSADAPLSGTVSLAATASDAGGVARVEFRIDGTLVATDTSSPYATSWDTTAAASGSHALAATAVDTLGNATTVTRSVTVDNSAPQPAPPPSASGGLFANPWPNAGVRQAIPADEPTDPDSAAMVSAFMGVSKNIGGSNSPTRLQGGPGDPVYTGIDGTRVYIHGTPFGGGGADDTMEVYNAVAPDGSTNLVTRYWTDGSLTFSDGRIGSSTTGSARIDGDGAPFRGNGTAWGLFSSVGVVLNEELAAGVIPHAVGVALGNNILSRSFRAPARSSESKAYGSTVPMGARFQITMPWDADRGDPARALRGRHPARGAGVLARGQGLRRDHPRRHRRQRVVVVHRRDRDAPGHRLERDRPRARVLERVELARPGPQRVLRRLHQGRRRAAPDVPAEQTDPFGAGPPPIGEGRSPRTVGAAACALPHHRP